MRHRTPQPSGEEIKTNKRLRELSNKLAALAVEMRPKPQSDDGKSLSKATVDAIEALNADRADLMAIRQTPFKWHDDPYSFLWMLHRYTNRYAPGTMRNYRVFFHCLPETSKPWKPCSDVVTAESPEQAIQTIETVKSKTYRIQVRGPYEAKETTDVPGPCWSPDHNIERYFNVSYSYVEKLGGRTHLRKGNTIVSALTAARAWADFERDNPHVTVTRLEDEHGNKTTKKP